MKDFGHSDDDHEAGKSVSLADQIAARRERERTSRLHVSHRLGHRDRDHDRDYHEHDDARHRRKSEQEVVDPEPRMRKRSETRRSRKSGSESPEPRLERKPKARRSSESRRKSETEAASAEISKPEVVTEHVKSKTDPKADDKSRKRPKSSSDEGLTSPGKKSKSGVAKLEFSQDIQSVLDDVDNLLELTPEEVAASLKRNTDDVMKELDELINS